MSCVFHLLKFLKSHKYGKNLSLVVGTGASKFVRVSAEDGMSVVVESKSCSRVGVSLRPVRVYVEVGWENFSVSKVTDRKVLLGWVQKMFFFNSRF